MAIENWIDDLCAVWEFTDVNSKLVKSYRVFNQDGIYEPFPEALNIFPCALTYSTVFIPHYESGEQFDLYQGVTELHCVSSVDKAHYPYVLTFLAKIRDAAAAHRRLGDKVSWFRLLYDGGPGPFGGTAIEGPGGLSYGSEEEHLGLLINWAVKEVVDVTLQS